MYTEFWEWRLEAVLQDGDSILPPHLPGMENILPNSPTPSKSHLAFNKLSSASISVLKFQLNYNTSIMCFISSLSKHRSDAILTYQSTTASIHSEIKKPYLFVPGWLTPHLGDCKQLPCEGEFADKHSLLLEKMHPSDQALLLPSGCLDWLLVVEVLLSGLLGHAYRLYAVVFLPLINRVVG